MVMADVILDSIVHLEAELTQLKTKVTALAKEKELCEKYYSEKCAEVDSLLFHIEALEEEMRIERLQNKYRCRNLLRRNGFIQRLLKK